MCTFSYCCQSLSHIWLFVTPWIAACQAFQSLTVSQSLPKFMSIELIMPSNHLILCYPLLLLPLIFPSIRIFSNKLAFRIIQPNYWSFSFSIVPPIRIQGWFLLGLTGLISLLSKGLLSLLQHHNSKVSILGLSAFFMVHFHIHRRLLEKP